MEVYIDVLFLENILINYLILVVAGRFSGKRASITRIFLAAFIGAAYVVVMVMCPSLKTFYTIGSKILLSFLIVTVAYKPVTIKDFLKDLASFYITTFIFAGAGYAIINMTNSGSIVKNGVFCFYGQNNWMVIVLTIALGVLILRVFLDLFRQRIFRKSFTVSVKIIVANKAVTIPALIDSGNTLYEPVSRLPVIVVEMEALKDLLPAWLIECSITGDCNIINNIQVEQTDSDWKRRFRVIPYNSLGESNGILLGFKPDIILVEDENGSHTVQEVVIGIYNKALSQDSCYQAIIGPELVA